MKHALPRLLITLGDVAGIGPEVLLKSWVKSDLFAYSQPVVVGDISWLEHLNQQYAMGLQIVPVNDLTTWPAANPTSLPCVQGSRLCLKDVVPGKPQAAAGQAAYDFLNYSITQTLRNQADAIVTLPLHKEGLHQAGLHYPGHTEILAEACHVKEYAMMLYAPMGKVKQTSSRGGLGVAHVTLHQSLRSIFDAITPENVLEKIILTADVMRKLVGNEPRIGVCALNPHASDGGIFGHEEVSIIEPAIKHAIQKGIHASGPWPSDTLFKRAQQGEFDGIVAMYHDQGHIALKLISGFHLVNITLGLPIIRTSVAHGTAYDIVHNWTADPYSLQAAVEVACHLFQNRDNTNR